MVLELDQVVRWDAPREREVRFDRAFEPSVDLANEREAPKLGQPQHVVEVFASRNVISKWRG